MATARARPDQIARLRDALEDAGCTVEIIDRGPPLRMAVTDPAGNRLELACYLHKLKNDWLPGSSARRIRVGRVQRPARGKVATFHVGYDEDRDVFAAWAAAENPKVLPGTSLRVSADTLDRATTVGSASELRRTAVLGRGSVFAFQPHAVTELVDQARDSMRARPTPDPAPPEYSARAEPPERVPEAAVRPNGDEGAQPSAAAEGASSASAKPAPGRPVVTGFAPQHEPREEVTPQQPLQPGFDYWFWFEVGADTKHSIEKKHVPLPVEKLPPAAKLTVHLFPFEKGLELGPVVRGEIQLEPDGSARVTDRAATVSDRKEDHQRRLFFPVKAPRRNGFSGLRCSVYLGSTLVQSRLVRCWVGDDVPVGVTALESSLDYSLSESLANSHLDKVPDHTLSVTVNGDEGTHELRFYSAAQPKIWAENASLQATALQNLVDTSRHALRMVAWGTKEPWTNEDYQYLEPVDDKTFCRDLARLAVRGWDLYEAVIDRFTGGPAATKELQKRMCKPGTVQIAATDPQLYLPAGLFYDYGIRSSDSWDDYDLCSQFMDSIAGPAPLEESPCITDCCPSRGKDKTVCPSGFWGYRHQIGWPLTTAEADFVVGGDGTADMAIGVSTDVALKQREDHIKTVLALGRGDVAESRTRLEELMRANPDLVYLYCHGGLSDDKKPYLSIGPLDSDPIARGDLRLANIFWQPDRPLVFINGCHTTALEPEQAAELVTGFIETMNAVGVIGTEISVFEPLATTFALSMLTDFIQGSGELGTAMRRARLELLKQRNPLGLVYVPFVTAGTRFRKQTTPA